MNRFFRNFNGLRIMQNLFVWTLDFWYFGCKYLSCNWCWDHFVFAFFFSFDNNSRFMYSLLKICDMSMKVLDRKQSSLIWPFGYRIWIIHHYSKIMYSFQKIYIYKLKNLAEQHFQFEPGYVNQLIILVTWKYDNIFLTPEWIDLTGSVILSAINIAPCCMCSVSEELMKSFYFLREKLMVAWC